MKTAKQTILFDREKWSVTSAKKWLKEHNLKIPVVDTTKEYHRFQQSPPFYFLKGTFRTINLGAKKNGIKAVIAIPKKVSKRNPTKQKKPWLPGVVVDLADPISIDIEGGEQLKFPLSGDYCLGTNRAGTELWILSRKNAKNVKTTDEKGDALYEAFTGFEHEEVGKMVQRSPKTMIKIGRAMNIVYRSDKFAKPGDNSDYIHPFTHYPIVSVDKINHPSIVALRGGRIKVKKEGITG